MSGRRLPKAMSNYDTLVSLMDTMRSMPAILMKGPFTDVSVSDSGTATARVEFYSGSVEVSVTSNKGHLTVFDEERGATSRKIPAKVASELFNKLANM